MNFYIKRTRHEYGNQDHPHLLFCFMQIATKNHRTSKAKKDIS